MIKTELLNNGTLIRHFSDSGKILLQNETGIEYGEAVDIVPCPYTYTEIDPPIEENETKIDDIEEE